MSVWFITGAGRGLGQHIAKAALDAGHQVVATGRNVEKVAKVFPQSPNLLVVKLDVISQADADAAAKATIEHFGRIDVLVNNAASFYAGYFEELSQRQMDLQLATSLVGPMNVTRAFLPYMRQQRRAKSSQSRPRLGASLIWRGAEGSYVDLQGQVAYFSTDLNAAGYSLVQDNGGTGSPPGSRRAVPSRWTSAGR
ncbi:MAG: short-chain dehydrogenase/oxidoreductase [Devosia sp.]|nr:SDR family NAD(P)-dependent oxidoreductase [Devosia sp.]MDB5587243.1 short-chain dehydrogenase/oxidoreductase [Devosia sp.]